jgi:hypothetical protein
MVGYCERVSKSTPYGKQGTIHEFLGSNNQDSKSVTEIDTLLCLMWLLNGWKNGFEDYQDFIAIAFESGMTYLVYIYRGVLSGKIHSSLAREKYIDSVIKTFLLDSSNRSL